MISTLSVFLQGAIFLSFLLLFLGMVFTFLRLMKGPTLPDRVVAIDLFTSLVMGTISTYAFLTGLTIYLNAVLIMAFIAFIGTVAFARYLEKRALK
ncbi:pH regulation protein F [candidate division KSB1 bacterium]|nr:pH regulation protein F [candidate division KSB1 bacterium]